MIKIKGRFALANDTQLRFKAVKKEELLQLVWQTASGLLTTREIGFAFSTVVQASSNGGSVTYAIISGNIPAGMILNGTTGALTGIPETAGTFEFTIRATSSGLSEARTFSLSITPIILTWTTAADLGSVRADTPLGQTFAATSSSGRSPTIEHVSGILPTGVRFEGSQLLGRAANLAGSFDLTLRARDGAVAFEDRRFALAVEADVVSWVSASNLGALDGSTVVSRSLEATSSFGRPLTYTVSGGTLPSGLTLGQGGSLDGTTGNGAGAFSFTVLASDGLASASRTFTGSIVPVTLSWQTPGTLPSAAGLSTLSRTLQATASNGGAVSYSVVSGSLPSGVSLTNGTLTGSLTNQGSTSTFTVRASYGGGAVVADRVFTLTVVPATITWATPTTLPTLRAENTLAPFAATSSTGRTPSYALVDGTLPPGLNLTDTGTVAGSAVNLGGSYSFTIRASDTADVVSERSFTVTLDPDVVVFTTDSAAYEATDGGFTIPALEATSHYGRPVQFALASGALPIGVTLASDGRFTGLPPNDASSYSFTVEATDGIASATRTFAMGLVRAVVTFSANQPSYIGEVSASSYYELEFDAATTSKRAVSYLLRSGTLPQGLSLLPSGVLGGVPAANVGSFTFVVEATDGVAVSERAFSLDIIVPPVWETPPTLARVNQGDALETNLIATPQNGNGVTYSVVTANGATRAAFTMQPPQANLAPITLALSPEGMLSGQIDSIDPDKPVWVTSSATIAQVPRGTLTNASVKANTVGSRTLRGYSIVGRRVLPAGLSINAATGTITGFADLYPADIPDRLESLQPAPLWNTTSGLLGSFSTSGATRTVSLSLSATPLLGNAITAYSIQDGTLPFGIVFAPAGTLTGTVDASAVLDGTFASQQPEPLWITPADLGVFTTRGNTATVSTTLSATARLGNAVTYAVASGALPFNATLSKAGLLSATFDPFTVLDGSFMPPVGPTWTTPAGSLGSSQNGTAQSIGLGASPRPDTTARFHVVSGTLPRGFLLTTTSTSAATATISGTSDSGAPNAALSAATTFAFTIRATGSDGGYTDRDFTYTITV